MSSGRVGVRTAPGTEPSGDGEGRRPGVPGAASALAGWFGRAARGWWRASAASACAVPRRAPRVRGSAQREGHPGRHRASAGRASSPPASSPPSPPDPSRAAPAGARRPRSLHTPDRPRGRLRRAAAAWLLACAAALALPALPGPGGVAHADVLVSNLGQANTSHNRQISQTSPSAQAFTTGSNIAGYALGLGSVELVLVAKPDDTTAFFVSIHEADGNEPGEVRYADLLPSADIAAGNNTFNAPADAFLKRDTTYFVMVEYNHPTNQSASVAIRTTENNSEDFRGRRRLEHRQQPCVPASRRLETPPPGPTR